MEIPDDTQMSIEFWREVERAKKMTPQERVAEGHRLFEEDLQHLAEEIRFRCPGISDEEMEQIRRQVLDARREAEWPSSQPAR